MRLADVEEPLAIPARDELERVGIRLERADPLDLRVEVPRVDESGAVLEAFGCDGAHERCRGGRCDHDHLLVGLDVGADLDDQLRVALEQLAFHDRGI